MISIKSEREIDIMRRAAEKLRDLFFDLRDIIRPGVKGIEINDKAEAIMKAQGATPAFKGYRGFPASICLSVDEEVVHGIPSERCLREGQIVSIDIGLVWKDFFSDAARTFEVGGVSREVKKLIETTKQALFISMEEMQVGKRVGDISHAIQDYVELQGYSVVRDFVGHGIGRALHEDPQVPNFGEQGKGQKLEGGMVLAVEPMVNMGGWEVEVLGNGWTVVTRDGKPSAHYEDTICLTESGPENLTADLDEG